MATSDPFRHNLYAAVLDRLVFALGLTSFATFILLFGFSFPAETQYLLHLALYFVAILFVGQEALRFVVAPSLSDHVRTRWVELFFVLLMLVSFFSARIIGFFLPLEPDNVVNLAIGYLALTQFFIFITQGIRYLREFEIFSRFELSPSLLMVISFLLPIFIGTLLLKLPTATTEGITWIDALFTATSAVCVTGLIVLDTATAFTPVGQVIIAFLIQIGGLGIMTITMSFGFLFSRGLAVKERMLFSELLAEERLGRIGRLLLQVTFFTLFTEAVGAVTLYHLRGGNFVEFDAILFFNSLFHSISAFCNAGFSLFTAGLADPQVASNVGYSTVIVLLITVGGIGYPVVHNLGTFIRDRLTKVRTSRTLLSSQSKLVLVATFLLFLVGSAFIYFAESNQSFAQLSVFEKIRQSVFLAAASRTAGYNIWGTELLSVETCLIVMFLMWIGGSPMSTAGGIKTVTFAIAWLNFVAVMRGSKRLIVFGKEVAFESIQKSYAIIFGSIFALSAGSLLLIVLEPEFSRLDLIFEVVSAMATVGLSRGVTFYLSPYSKFLLVVLMFVGRLGIIVVLNSFYRRYQEPHYKLLKESIPIS